MVIEHTVDDPGPLTRPLLVAAFDGWSNAGQAATGAADVLAEDGGVIVRFDPDRLFDYRAVRPLIRFSDGVLEEVEWPVVSIRHRRFPERDVLVLSGPEPNWSWREMAETVCGLTGRFGVVEYVALGGIPWATPHTRPVTLLTTSTSPDRLEGEHPFGILRAPGSIMSAIELEVAALGIPTVTLWARVPHYVGALYQPAVLSLVDEVARRGPLSGLPLADLAVEAEEQRNQLDTIADSRPDIKAIIDQLETMTDEQPPVSGDQLAAEIERFLRSQDD